RIRILSRQGHFPSIQHDHGKAGLDEDVAPGHGGSRYEGMGVMAKPVCAVAGVGPGNGAAFARRFASEGYALALLARGTELTAKLAGELSDACAYECDLADAASVARAFEDIRRDLGDPDVLIYNAGSGVWGAVEEAAPADFENAWRVN